MDFLKVSFYLFQDITLDGSRYSFQLHVCYT